MYNKKEIVKIAKDLMLFRYYKMSDFNVPQLNEIYEGIRHELSYDQVDTYLNPKLSPRHMAIMRTYLEFDMPIKKVSVVANPEFTELQVREILNGFDLGLTDEQMKLCTCPISKVKGYFRSGQMNEIISGFVLGLNINQVKIYAKLDFDEKQMNEIKLGLINHLPIKAIQIYAHSYFDVEQMKVVREGLLNKLTINQVNMYADRHLSVKTMKAMMDGFIRGLSIEQMETCIDIADKEYAIPSIIEGFLRGLTMDQLKLCATECNITNDKMDYIYLGIRQGFSAEQLDFLKSVRSDIVPTVHDMLLSGKPISEIDTDKLEFEANEDKYISWRQPNWVI